MKFLIFNDRVGLGWRPTIASYGIITFATNSRAPEGSIIEQVGRAENTSPPTFP
jgi:hypothetical protein